MSEPVCRLHDTCQFHGSLATDTKAICKNYQKIVVRLENVCSAPKTTILCVAHVVSHDQVAGGG